MRTMSWIFHSLEIPERSQRLGLVAVVLSFACAPALSTPLVPVEDGRIVMGTVLDLALLVEAGDELRARQAVRDAFARVEALEAVVSRFEPQSEVSRLKRGPRRFRRCVWHETGNKPRWQNDPG